MRGSVASIPEPGDLALQGVQRGEGEGGGQTASGGVGGVSAQQADPGGGGGQGPCLARRRPAGGLPAPPPPPTASPPTSALTPSPHAGCCKSAAADPSATCGEAACPGRAPRLPAEITPEVCDSPSWSHCSPCLMIFTYMRAVGTLRGRIART